MNLRPTAALKCWAWCWGLAWCVAWCLTSAAHAADKAPATATETRDYEVLIDGKAAGKSRTTISEFADGQIQAATQADVKLSFVVYTYIYQFQGSELWQGNKLIRVASRAQDGGKKMSLKAAQGDRESRVALNDGAAQVGPVFALTTNTWRMPPGDAPREQLQLLDADTGKIMRSQLERVGPVKLQLAGQQVSAFHYRLTGDVTAEIWCDQSRRLLVHQTTEEGRTIEMRLVNIQRPAAPAAARR